VLATNTGLPRVFPLDRACAMPALTRSLSISPFKLGEYCPHTGQGPSLSAWSYQMLPSVFGGPEIRGMFMLVREACEQAKGNIIPHLEGVVYKAVQWSIAHVSLGAHECASPTIE
jgi:hypothetical protein